MADFIPRQDDGVPPSMRTRYRDMNDTTHALVVAADGNSTVLGLPQWEYLDGEVIAPAGVATAATLPATATVVELRPEGGVCYFQINAGAPASAASPGYIAEDGGEIIGPLSNLNSLQLFAAVGVDIHVLYFREVP